MVLELSEISKKYGKREVLHKIDMQLNPGIYGLLGPNGAGKTTLLNIITGLLKQSSGSVMYDGSDINRLGNKFRKILGYLPQEPGLYPFYTGREILKYFAKLKAIDNSDERIEEILNLVHLYDDADKKIGEYSGGMKRRIGIAIALLNKPQVLVLDEPSAGLDPKERIRFRNVISKIKHESIVIVSTHIVSDIEHVADNIIFLDGGRIIAQDRCNCILEAIKDKVWYVEEEYEKGIDLISNLNVTNTVNLDMQHVGVKIISDECPCINAKHIYPTLEDAYMYYLGSDYNC